MSKERSCEEARADDAFSVWCQHNTDRGTRRELRRNAFVAGFAAGAAGARTPTLPAAPYDDMTDFEDATQVIREWVQGGGVNTTALTRELLYWASWAAGDRPPAEREERR